MILSTSPKLPHVPQTEHAIIKAMKKAARIEMNVAKIFLVVDCLTSECKNFCHLLCIVI
ncbi:MAG: hypothetical protein MJ200_01015 [Mycoplasmoidaceae bacterium]|nr:hypothetical protein [Mycoplasmoidaceae bacterium]